MRPVPPATPPRPEPAPADAATARAFADLLASAPAWLHRRSERVRFHDEVTVARTAVVDLTVPAAAPTAEDGSRLVPVAVLAKRPLARFTVTDEEQRPLPVLTAEENARLARLAVRAWAEDLLDGALAADVAADLDAVVGAPRAGWRGLGRLWHGTVHAGTRNRLRRAAGGVFAAHVEALADGFLVVVSLVASPGQRRVVTVRRDEHVGHRSPAGPVERVGRAVGWRPAAVILPVSAVLAGRSAHVELEVPRDVDVDRAVARRRRPTAVEVLAAAGDAPHVHLHLGALTPGDVVTVEVDLRADPHGWVAQSAWAATGVAAALTGAGWRLGALVGRDGSDSAAAASLLLGLTGLAATLLVRPREHRLATCLLAGLRWLAAIPPVAAAGVAGLLVVGPSRPLLDAVWWALTVACVAVAVLLQAVRHAPRARPPPPAPTG